MSFLSRGRFFFFCAFFLSVFVFYHSYFSFSRQPQPHDSLSIGSSASQVLNPVKLDGPRDTMVSYLKSMKDYQRALKRGDKETLWYLDRASRSFNLKEVPFILRRKEGRKAALLLKEVLDRVIHIDPEKIPKTLDENSYWRLKGTEIVIYKEEEGEQKGEYLFSPKTTFRLEEFYNKVKHFPYLKGLHGSGYKEDWAETYIPKWVQGKFLGFKKWKWLGLFLAFLLSLALKALSEGFVKKMRILLERRKIPNSYKRRGFLLALEKPIGLFTASLFGLFCVYFFKFEGLLGKFFFYFLKVIFSFSLIWFVYRLVGFGSEVLRRRAQGNKTKLDYRLIPLLEKFFRLVVLVIGTLLVVQNLGFNVMSLLAGLGLGGLALALAARDTAANLFGSIMIFMDRPFTVGDYIITSGIEGDVEWIGFRSTRIRTFYNSLVSVPNASLANDNIDNMGKRRYRRVKTYLSVTYDTSVEKMEAFIEGIKKILKEHQWTRKNYFHVVFNEYGASSLNILLYFFLEASDWGTELKGKEDIFFKIYKLAEKLQVKFAFPTQSVHVESLPSSK